jgi:hypothetical protein
MRRTIRLVAASLCGLAALCGSIEQFGRAQAEDAAANRAIGQLLEVGWGDSFRVLGPARDEFDKAKSLAPRDPRVPLAFALINIKHGKHSDAAKLLDEVLSLDRRHVAAREAKIWIDVLMKRYAAALVQIDELSGMLPPKDEPGASEDVKSRWRETSRYLGRLFGFFEGPAEKSAPASRVADVKKQVLARLSAEHRQEFEAGHKAVSDRFAEFFLRREQTKEDEVAAQKKSQEENAKRLAEDKATVASDKKAVAQQAAETREQLDKYLSEIERKLAPLDKEYARLNAQAVGVRERIIDLDRDISRLLRLAESTKDPALAARYRLDADRVRDVRSRHSADYRVLESQAGRVRTQQAALLGERDALISRYNAEAKRLGREQVKLGQTEKRIAREEDRNRKTPTGNTDKVHALSQKVSAFTTYEPFPLERAKARLVESLR